MSPLFIVFSNLGLGGVQKKIVDIVNLLAKTQPNLPIYILLRRRNDFDLGNKIKNRRVEIINYTDWARVKTPFFFTFFLLYQVWQLKPEAILSFLSPFSLPAVLAKLAFFWRKTKVVINEDHYTSGIVPLLRYSKLNRWGIKLFYPKADLIISPTRAAKKDLVDNFGVPEEKIKIVPNWTHFANRRITKVPPKYDLIYAGRLERPKRIDFLLRGIVEMKKAKEDIRLCLLGDGKEKVRLENFAKRKGIKDNVDFGGARQDVENFLAKSRLFVCTSQFGAEGFPLAILEAMAIGVPILAFRFAGVEDVIKDGESGFIFNSFKELIKKTLWLLENQAERKAAAKQAKAIVKKDHSLKNANDYLQALGLEVK